MALRRSMLWVGVSVLLAAAASIAWHYRTAPDAGTASASQLSVSPDCDSARTRCIAGSGDFAIEVSLGPAVRPMQPFDIRLRAVQGQLSHAAQVELQFQMRGMDMGLNRYRLMAAEDGAWRGQAILPVCSQGRSDWLVRLDIRDAGRHWTAELPFTTD